MDLMQARQCRTQQRHEQRPGQPCSCLKLTTQRDVVVPNGELNVFARHSRHRAVFHLRADMAFRLVGCPWSGSQH